MTTAIERMPNKHKPHIRYKLADGTVVPGVTTALGILDKPQLVKWANNLGLQGIDSSKYVDELGEVGTLAHYLIQCDILGLSPDVSEYSQFQQDRAAEAIKSWKSWRKVHTIEPILNEELLVSEVFRYGGTIDLFAMIDGVPTLADIKTAKAIYSEHMTQVVGYKNLLVEHACRQSLPVPTDFRIIRVGREPGEGFEDRPIDKLDERWKLFMACLNVYNLLKAVK